MKIKRRPTSGGDPKSLHVGKPGSDPSFTSFTRKNVERWLQQLKAASQIEFRGVPKTGGYHTKP